MGLLELIKENADLVDEAFRVYLRKSLEESVDRNNWSNYDRMELLATQEKVNRDYSICRAIFEPMYTIKRARMEFSEFQRKYQIKLPLFKKMPTYSILLVPETIKLGSLTWLMYDLLGFIKDKW